MCCWLWVVKKRKAIRRANGFISWYYCFFLKTRVNLWDQIHDLIKIYCKIANSDSNHLKSNDSKQCAIKLNPWTIEFMNHNSSCWKCSMKTAKALNEYKSPQFKSDAAWYFRDTSMKTVISSISLYIRLRLRKHADSKTKHHVFIIGNRFRVEKIESLCMQFLHELQVELHNIERFLINTFNFDRQNILPKFMKRFLKGIAYVKFVIQFIFDEISLLVL